MDTTIGLRSRNTGLVLAAMKALSASRETEKALADDHAEDAT